MNDKIKDHIIRLILEDKEISGKEKAQILKELFDSQPCLREHFPTPYPWYIPCPCPPDVVSPTYPTITYTTGNILDNSCGASDLTFNLHPNN